MANQLNWRISKETLGKKSASNIRGNVYKFTRLPGPIWKRLTELYRTQIYLRAHCTYNIDIALSKHTKICGVLSTQTINEEVAALALRCLLRTQNNQSRGWHWTSWRYRFCVDIPLYKYAKQSIFKCFEMSAEWIVYINKNGIYCSNCKR